MCGFAPGYWYIGEGRSSSSNSWSSCPKGWTIKSSCLLNDPGSKVCHNPVTKIRWVHVVPGHKTCSAAEEDLSYKLCAQTMQCTHTHTMRHKTLLFFPGKCDFVILLSNRAPQEVHGNIISSHACVHRISSAI